ncbi:MAG TPA: FmdE family protein [Terriglobia bacterium]|nr:FmdE family protein [Terriglobia bacterium]
MIGAKDFLEDGLKLHGHKCPAMPLGLRAGATAMNKMGISRTGDSEWLALVELGDNHCATCFADGIQMITGCTFGKGNIHKLNYGKWGLTLIDKKRKKAVRVVPRAKVMLANKKTEFFQNYRMKGVPPTKVPVEVVEPLVDNVMNAPEDQLFQISEIFDYPYHEPHHSFSSFVCEECGEMVVEEYGRLKNGKKVCIPCAEKQ